MRHHLLTLAVVAGLAFVAGSARGATPSGEMPLTTPIYSASEVDALLDGAGASLGDVTNYVAEAITEYGADDPAAELHKLILADLWRRVDALDGADGSGYVTAAQVEEMWAAALDEAVDDLKGADDALRLELMRDRDELARAAAVCEASTRDENFVPLAPTTVNAATITATSGQSIPLSRKAATRRYRTGTATVLTITSFTGLSQNPCWLVLSGYSSVTWPSGAVLTNGAYESGKVNYFRVCYVYNKTFVEKVSAQ